MSYERAIGLAEYLLTWLESRNGGELLDAFQNMRVRDANLLRAELVMILQHGGKPPNWV